MKTETTLPYNDLIEEHKIDVAMLPEKTQKRIAKINEETDEVKRETLDESICGDIWDYIDEKEKKGKEEEKKRKHEALKQKKIDLSKVATAQPAVDGDKPKVTDKKNKEYDILYL